MFVGKYIRHTSSDFRLVSDLCFRLLPVQILLAMVGVANGILSSLFASNYIGPQALSIVGLYNPVRLFIGAVGVLLLSGSQILVGQYMGKNKLSKAHNIFSLNIVICLSLGVFVSLLLAVAAAFDLTDIFAQDVQIREHFNKYLLGSAIGILPQLLGQQLSGFLSLENRIKRTVAASVACIVSNLALNYLFVVVFPLGTFGLAAASSVGLWVFFLVQAQYFIGGRSDLSFSFRKIAWENSREIIKIGLPNALSSGYLAVRSIIVNALLVHYTGSFGLSAFVACNSFLDFFWAIPAAMCAVSRMLISVAVGEEDAVILKENMRVMFRRFVPIMAMVAVIIFGSAEFLSRLYCQDISSTVFAMTTWGFRILPFCMPLSVICMHFVCYGQVSSKHFLVYLLSLFDSIVSVSIFSMLLVPLLGVIGIYLANVINGIISIAIIVIYAWVKGTRFPRTLDELMLIPPNFGASKDSRIDITLKSMEDAVNISRRIHSFCLKNGIDDRRSFFAALALEEMATIIIKQGFNKPKHAILLRVTCKDNAVILRIKDNCKPFNYSDLREVLQPQDPTANIGIQIIRSITKNVQYLKILGMNTIILKI